MSAGTVGRYVFPKYGKRVAFLTADIRHPIRAELSRFLSFARKEAGLNFLSFRPTRLRIRALSTSSACCGFLDLSGSVAHELSAILVEEGKRQRAQPGAGSRPRRRA